MKKNQNYYNDILMQINKRITSKDYKEAYKLILLELDMPYLSLEFENKLQSLLADVIKSEPNLVKNNHAELGNLVLTEEVLLTKLLATDPQQGDIDWIFGLENINLRKYIHELEVFLLNNNNDNFAKTFLLDIIRTQEINHEFKIAKFGQIYHFNPVVGKLCFQTDHYLQVLKLLEEITMQNPDYFIICSQIWKWLNAIMFPKLIKNHLNFHDWACSIYYYVLKLQKQDIDLDDFAYKFHCKAKDISELVIEIDIINPDK